MIKRPYYLNQLIQLKDSDFIKIMTGVRRCGKSAILMIYRDYLIEQGVSKDHIVYMDLESFEFQFIRNDMKFTELLTKTMPKDGEKIYFMFDEIQRVEGWQRVVNGLRERFNCDITVTGSNAKMKSRELETLLSGRYVEIPVYPLSFKEFLDAKGIARDSRAVDQAYLEYEMYGGFPAVVLGDESIKDTILSGIFDTIILNGISSSSEVKDVQTLKKLISFLADNVGQIVNVNKITNTFKSEGIKTSNHTINRYLELLENAYTFYHVDQYDIRGRDYLRSHSKYFIVDSGLRRQAIGKKEGNYSNRLENVVFVELLRRGYFIDIGRIGSKEIDFIARKQDEIVYVQVAYDLPNNTHETDNLLNIKDNHKKILITGRYQQIEQIDGIPVINIVDWLLEE